MKRFFFNLIALLAFVFVHEAQSPADTRQQLRIVDTLSAEQKKDRVPILLKAELDSMIAAHLASVPKEAEPQTEAENEMFDYWPWVAAAAWLAILVLMYLLWNNQQRANRHLLRLYKQIQHMDTQLLSAPVKSNASDQTGKKKMSSTAMEKEILELKEQIAKSSREKQGMEMMLDEYRLVKQEYEGLKQQMMDVYKVRHYPGFAKERSETEILTGLVATERAVAHYAYERFLKPIIQITDANKNHPARITEDDKQKIADMLVSMGLLYSEYLYLRIGELSIGGRMVERIGSLQKGNGIDPTLLKQLNTEHGSRALALRLAIDTMGLRHLSYPVFEETNLNLS